MAIIRQTATFECSDADLNAIHNMIQYTMKCLTFQRIYGRLSAFGAGRLWWRWKFVYNEFANNV